MNCGTCKWWENLGRLIRRQEKTLSGQSILRGAREARDYAKKHRLGCGEYEEKGDD